MIPGKDLIVSVDAYIYGQRFKGAIAASKTCSVRVEQSFINSCSPISGRAKDKIPTEYSWGVDVDCLCPNTIHPEKLLVALKQGIKMRLTFFVGGIRQSGDAYPTSWEMSGDVKSLLKFRVSFTGSGELEDSVGEGWDFHHGTLYTYGQFTDGSLTPNPTAKVENGSLKKNN